MPYFGGHLVDHREQEKIEAHVVELQPLEVRQLAGLDQADGKERREHDRARALGEIGEAVAVGGRGAAGAVDGDDQPAGRPVAILQRFRDMQAVAERAGRPEGRRRAWRPRRNSRAASVRSPNGGARSIVVHDRA